MCFCKKYVFFCRPDPQLSYVGFWGLRWVGNNAPSLWKLPNHFPFFLVNFSILVEMLLQMHDCQYILMVTRHKVLNMYPSIFPLKSAVFFLEKQENSGCQFHLIVSTAETLSWKSFKVATWNYKTHF